MRNSTRTINALWYLPFALLSLAGAAAAYAEEGTETRLSSSSQGQGLRGGGSPISLDEFAPLITTGERTATSRVAGQQKPSVGEPRAPDQDFWIYSADVVLYSDLDGDGYFAGIDLAFDADTNFAAADVYAVVYLSYELGPWNEYAATDDFSIFGASGSDEYFIDTELLSGYPTGSYDILIELFDAFDGTFLTSFGPDESSELSLLPIEDAGRDTPLVTTIVHSQGGGGSLSWIALLALLGIVVLQRRAISQG